MGGGGGDGWGGGTKDGVIGPLTTPTLYGEWWFPGFLNKFLFSKFFSVKGPARPLIRN
jgi:hypothetical protein